MKLSTQGQHAIMAMLTLAINDDERTVRLSDIAGQQGISLSYLEQVFAKLRQKGLVEGIRGPGGGYRLARATDEISLAEIARVAESEEETVTTKPAKSGNQAQHKEQVLVQQMWDNLSHRFYDFLGDITLASLLEGHNKPRKVFQLGETASLIARMFPARRANSGLTHHVAM